MNRSIGMERSKYRHERRYRYRNGPEVMEKSKKHHPRREHAAFQARRDVSSRSWPAYFQKSKGCKVWDLDGKEYTDMCIMKSIGTNTLGYGHPEVDEAVMRTLQAGNMSTFNCPEEVYLAEKLIELHSWADMVRFARSGGEANAIAIRIARAASGKDKVAFVDIMAGMIGTYLQT